MNRLIFLDIDGTLIVTGRPQPGQRTIDAIRTARAQGYGVFLSTGRREGDVPPGVAAIGFDGGIFSAGARAVVHGTEIWNRPIPEGMAGEILRTLKEEHICGFLECAGGTYAIPPECGSPDAVREMHRFLSQELRASSITEKASEAPIYKIVYLAASRAQASELTARLHPSIKAVSFGHLAPDIPAIAGEISDRAISKRTAFLRICEYLKVRPEDCIAFGDSMNDAEILQAAGTGIAMGNADDALIPYADQVCESCMEDGVARALTRLGILQADP